jgi:hypothetical protein
VSKSPHICGIWEASTGYSLCEQFVLQTCHLGGSRLYGEQKPEVKVLRLAASSALDNFRELAVQFANCVVTCIANF